MAAFRTLHDVVAGLSPAALAVVRRGHEQFTRPCRRPAWWRRLAALVIAVLLLPALAGAKDLTILSGGVDQFGVRQAHYPAIPYQRPAEIAAALLQMSAAIEAQLAANPNRPLPIPCLGMSNAQTFCQLLGEHLKTRTAAQGGYKDLKRPGVTIVECAASGQTAKEWADPLNPRWQTCMERVELLTGVSRDDVVFGIHFLSQVEPAFNGNMNVADVEAIAHNFRGRFPQSKFLITTTINWTGQNLGKHAPIWSVHADQAVLISTARVHANGLAVLYLPIYADGNVPNPDTVSTRSPIPITWDHLDTADDGIHLTGKKTLFTGAAKGARSIWGRLYDDPAFRFLWR